MLLFFFSVISDNNHGKTIVILVWTISVAISIHTDNHLKTIAEVKVTKTNSSHVDVDDEWKIFFSYNIVKK